MKIYILKVSKVKIVLLLAGPAVLALFAPRAYRHAAQLSLSLAEPGCWTGHPPQRAFIFTRAKLRYGLIRPAWWPVKDSKTFHLQLISATFVDSDRKTIPLYKVSDSTFALEDVLTTDDSKSLVYVSELLPIWRYNLSGGGRLTLRLRVPSPSPQAPPLWQGEASTAMPYSSMAMPEEGPQPPSV